MDSKYTKVHVKSVNLNPGWDSHCRGGHRWPVAGRTVLVSQPLLASLRSCKFTSVDAFADGEPEATPLELVVAKTYVDPLLAAQQEKVQLEAELKAEKAAAEAQALRAELEALRKSKSEPKADDKKSK